MATLGAWPPILPNQAPGGEGWNGHGWWGWGLAAGAKRSHEKGIGLDQGKQTWWELGKAEFSIAVTEAQALGLLLPAFTWAGHVSFLLLHSQTLSRMVVFPSQTQPTP